MDGTIVFTTGLTDGVAWPWPIAVYLFLAGISGGAMTVALALNLFTGKNENTPILKSATVIGFATIVLGMVCLVLDLTDPLNFWRILVFYNPTSVMSIGVMLLLFYIPLVFVLMVMAFPKVWGKIPGLKWLPAVCDWLESFRGCLTWVVLCLAVAICAYTGFLISALIRFPLINTAVLPALFIASGISAGMAATKVCASWFFGENPHSPEMSALHKAEWPVLAVEAFCLFMIVIALLSGTAAGKAALDAFTTGVWAQVFWIGAVGVGFLVPLILGILGAKRPEGLGEFYISGLCAIGGMLCLRLFILYAGQTFSLV